MARLEREVSQKRTLLEDLRLKLRLAKESAKSDLQTLEGKTEEVERIKSIMEQNKTTVSSVRMGHVDNNPTQCYFVPGFPELGLLS